jgi:hypothetical protein
MKSRPILFNSEMVRAILNGSKTKTRRVIKPQPDMGKAIANLADCSVVTGIDMAGAIPGVSHMGLLGMTTCTASGYQPWGYTEPNIRCPFGQPGDRLWVRETWAHVPTSAYRRSDGVQQTINPNDQDMAAVYAAGWDRSAPGRWRPSLHMPRWASRITLEITAVRVERLNEISGRDACAEGVSAATEIGSPEITGDEEAGYFHPTSHVDGYARLWESIYGPGSWDANPWVWVVEFKRVEADQ